MDRGWSNVKVWVDVWRTWGWTGGRMIPARIERAEPPLRGGGRERGVDDVNYGRSKRAVVVAVVVCVDFKKKSAHRGRSACPATRKRDALPPVHRNRTRLPRFAAPPASRCINTTKGGRTDRNRPRTRSRYSKRELLAFIAIIVVVVFFLLDDRSSFRDRSTFVLLVDLY